MGFMIGSAVGALLVTLVAARFVVRRWPEASLGAQVIRSALAFPVIATVLFALATATTLFQPRPANRPDLDPGMPVFALVFFLLYALAIGAIIGVPTALVAIRGLRAG